MKPENFVEESGHQESTTNPQPQLEDKTDSDTLVQLGFIGGRPLQTDSNPQHVSMTPELNAQEQGGSTIEEAPFEVNKVGGKPVRTAVFYSGKGVGSP